MAALELRREKWESALEVERRKTALALAEAAERAANERAVAAERAAEERVKRREEAKRAAKEAATAAAEANKSPGWWLFGQLCLDSSSLFLSSFFLCSSFPSMPCRYILAGSSSCCLQGDQKC